MKKPEVTDVTVSFSGTGNIESTTTIDNIYKIDMNSSGVVGLVGAPVEISSTSYFDDATITFTYDESKLGDISEENLAVMWYDEENGQFIILDQDSVVDTENNTVSYTTTHFSKYMLVDSQQWYDTWRINIDYRTGSYNETYYDFAFVVDTSGSMSGNSINYAKTAMNRFVDCLSDNDHAGLVRFSNSAAVVCPMGSSKQTLKSGVNSLTAGGGTRVSQGLSAGINQLMSYNTGNKKAIILICDGDVDSVDSLVDIACDNDIVIYTVNVVASNSSKLQSMADRTGGEYYYASNSSDLIDKLDDLCGGTIYGIDLTDSDGDGLPDVFEINGMRLSNGQTIYTDPLKPDTDGDGIPDGQEMGAVYLGSIVNIDGYNVNIVFLPDGRFYIGDGEYLNSAIFFNLLSNPNMVDSDFDGLQDFEDPYPCCFNEYYRYDRDKVLEYCDKYYNIPNDDYYYYDSDCANFVSQCVHAGGIPMNDDWYFYDEGLPIKIGERTQYLNDNLSDSWIGAYQNYEYFKNNTQICNNIVEFSSKEEMQSAFIDNRYMIQPGDLLYMEWDTRRDEGPTHATVIDGFVAKNNTWTYSGHTNSRNRADIVETFWEGRSNGKLYVVSIKDVVIIS